VAFGSPGRARGRTLRAQQESCRPRPSSPPSLPPFGTQQSDLAAQVGIVAERRRGGRTRHRHVDDCGKTKIVIVMTTTSSLDKRRGERGR
jgi:hypothetical protein